MKIVQNYKENILKSASDSTYIFLLKIKILFGFFCIPSPQYTPVKPSTLQYIVVPCTLKYSVYPVSITFHKKIWELQIGVFPIPPTNESSAV